MIPSLDALMSAINAINAQHPAQGNDIEGRWIGGERETSGLHRLVLRLTGEQVSTICAALGVTSQIVHAESKSQKEGSKSPAQIGWAGIIDVALTARGAPPDEMRLEAFDALTRVDVPTLERMAALVLGETPCRRGPSSDAAAPETVAEKANSAYAQRLADREDEKVRASGGQVPGKGGK